MFDRFTDAARKALGMAREAAIEARHDYIAPVHMLLGLLDTQGGAASILKHRSIDPVQLRLETVELLPPGRYWQVSGTLPFTPEAKRVLEFSLEESTALGHRQLGTEHLLLGLMRLQEHRPDCGLPTFQAQN